MSGYTFARWSFVFAVLLSVPFVIRGQSRRAGEATQVAGIDMVYIPAGSFMLGSETGEADERPVHQVTLDAFYMSTREVKHKQWLAVMGENKSEFANLEMPIMGVNWYDAVRFCNRLSDKAGFQRSYNENTWECDFSKNGFRLPTEAEWEYAAKAGGQPDSQRDEFKAGKQNDRDYLALNKVANAYGIFDLFGTEWEWCNDWYDADYYSKSSAKNPTGAKDGDFRIIRGAGWYLYANFCRACDRNQIYPYQKSYNLTVRIARNAQ